MFSLNLHVKTGIQSVGTYPQHGAILKHMWLVTNHTVFIQHRDPLLGKLNRLNKTIQGNKPVRFLNDGKTQPGLGALTAGDLNSYLHQEAAVSDWNAFCTICL